ncbi:hypothetical protein PEX1_095600 [Penicillium expansum]|uniref:Uncharacterized protein n=1 Tax=Penicillium expansum TaxID=27334 RepID=A0A0A2JFT5_PENEN|nr:hypothetical protein PEX2_039430 [Penicillium expansum]KGO38712.1 hypothetical protein PEXP_109900 [Penicillium expansum]KGO54239.1 hypothetical protein PEX2_039430 [Penicillium expansum]KGO56514.1 hypothetical protein PEX1_095600 [Penicillium expansum]
MPTYKRKCDTVANNVYTTEQRMSIEQWLEDTTKRIEGPAISLGFNISPKRLGGLEQRSDMNKELLERDYGQGDKIVDMIGALNETVHRQEEERLEEESELQENVLQENITRLQEQLSMQDSFQQHSGLKSRLSMHEKLLEVTDQQIHTQQKLIKHLLEAHASTSRQLALISQKLSQQPEQSAQQPQVEEAEGQQSNPGGANTITDDSEYIFVSEDEATLS